MSEGVASIEQPADRFADMGYEYIIKQVGLT